MGGGELLLHLDDQALAQGVVGVDEEGRLAVTLADRVVVAPAM